MIQLLRILGPGCARFRVPQLYRSTAFKQYLELALGHEPLIHKVTANVITANILIRFSQEIPLWKIAGLLQDTQERYLQDESGDGLPPKQSTHTTTVTPPATPSNTWHQIPLQEVRQYWQTPEIGLTTDQASARLKQFGWNVLDNSPPRSQLSILLGQFQSLPVILLGTAAGVSLFTEGIADALVILGVLGANGAIGYLTESQSERIIAALGGQGQAPALVQRNGTQAEVNAAEVVPGDLLILKPGQVVAADARLVAVDSLSIDESALTGESIPVQKTSQALPKTEIPLADRQNMVYKGTLVTGGQGQAVVVATGQTTEMGQIQKLVGEVRASDTPLAQQLDQVGQQLVWIGCGVCGLMFAIGLLRGYGVLPMLKSAISLAVAAVPEGLPTIATTVLALGVQKMRNQNILVRGLSAVESLGAVQTICLDKTGTLTENKMAVVELYTGAGRVHVQGGRLMRAGEVIGPESCPNLHHLLQVAVLCNESQVMLQADGALEISGSATEAALVRLALESGLDITTLTTQFALLGWQQRSENRNFMASFHQDGTQQLISVKGSPLEVLDRCNRLWQDGEVVALTDPDRRKIAIENDRLAGQALRVLGFAQTTLSTNSTVPLDPVLDLVWLGLVGMADPVRPGVKELIAQFHQAGIATVMITGDQTPTAYAIGKALQLSQQEHLQILDSTALSQLSPEALAALCPKVDVFARVSPAHKLQIVQSLQRSGQVVAMTGDGMNDAPALKTANVGVAMGNSGTEVAREVAELILEDDRLETMIAAVLQGRSIYSNIRRSVHFLLATNLSEIAVMLLAMTTGWGQPLNPLQLLWLNLVSDVFPALALAMEPPDADLLQQPPRDPQEPIIPSDDFSQIGLEAILLTLGTLSAYSYGIYRYGVSPRASTLAFLTLTAGQLFHAYTCRSQRSLFDLQAAPPPHNPFLMGALAGSFVLLALGGSVPWLRQLLRVTPMDGLDLLVISSGALCPLLINEITKLWSEPS